MSSVESLERRTLLNGDAFAHITAKGTLDVLGDASANVITVARDGDTIVATCDGDALSFPATSIKRVGVTAGGGNDLVTLDVSLRSIILGQGGDDTLNGGSNDDMLDGGDGDDVLDGRMGNDFFAGGDGFDAADYFSREFGLFLVELDARNENDEVPANPVEEDGLGRVLVDDRETDRIGFFVEHIGGTSGVDHFAINATGNIGRSVEGRGGDDVFRYSFAEFGTPGTTLFGDAGDDFFDVKGRDLAHPAAPLALFGGRGDDLVFLDETNEDPARPNVIDGGADRDALNLRTHLASDPLDMRLYPTIEDAANVGPPAVIIGNDLSNRITGMVHDVPGNAPITLHGIGGDDTLIGGGMNDALFGGDGDDVLIGGLGDDTLRGDGGNDAIGGNGGNDRLFGHGGNDDLNGGNGADRIDGGAGADTFNGGAGNDRLFSRDTVAEGVNGGPGDDAAEADDELDALFSVETELP